MLNRNVFHIIADLKAQNLFDIITREFRSTLNVAKVKRYLNEGMNKDSSLTPLFYCFPNQELAEFFISFGADGSQLNLA